MAGFQKLSFGLCSFKFLQCLGSIEALTISYNGLRMVPNCLLMFRDGSGWYRSHIAMWVSSHSAKMLDA